MSAYPPAPSSGNKKTRPPIACLNCRRHKVKCIQTTSPPTGACTRCTTKNIVCEIPTDPLYAYGAPAQTFVPASLIGPAGPTPDQGGALPYTGPPPPVRPRYSDGVPYPNLSLGNNEPQALAAQPSRTASLKPRYAHGSYPDLSLSGTSQSQSQYAQWPTMSTSLYSQPEPQQQGSSDAYTPFGAYAGQGYYFDPSGQ